MAGQYSHSLFQPEKMNTKREKHTQRHVANFWFYSLACYLFSLFFFGVCMCFSLTGLSHRRRQCRSNSKPAARGEKESICEERSGARYHRYTSQRHAAEQRSISHYAYSTQAPRCTNTPQQRQHLFLSVSYKDFICRWPLFLLCYYVSEHWRTGIKHWCSSGNLIQPAGH